MTITHRAFASSLLILVLGTAFTLAADSATTTVGGRIPPERFELKVLKAFAAKDGEAIFRAYLVKWKDQEVVVSDSLAKSNYKEGDTITVLAMNHPFPQGKEPHRLLSFTVVPPPPSR
jgi:hypothetical protein